MADDKLSDSFLATAGTDILTVVRKLPQAKANQRAQDAAAYLYRLIQEELNSRE